MATTQVLLTEAVPNLGAEADLVRVKRGYAFNYLIPSGKALEVNASSLRQINHLKARRAEREARELTQAEELATRLGKLKLTFELETGESGKAFGSVTAKDIHDRLLKEIPGLELPKHAVELDKAIKETGAKTVLVRVHRDVTAKLNIKITTPVVAETPEETAAEERPAKKTSRKKKSEKTTE